MAKMLFSFFGASANDPRDYDYTVKRYLVGYISTGFNSVFECLINIPEGDAIWDILKKHICYLDNRCLELAQLPIVELTDIVFIDYVVCKIHRILKDAGFKHHIDRIKSTNLEEYCWYIIWAD